MSGRLTVNSTPAERRRGCIFSESFENNSNVVANGGAITGTVTISNNQISFGSSGANYIQYDISEWGPTLSAFSFVAVVSQDNNTNFKRVFSNDGTALEFYTRDGVDTCTFRINGTAYNSDAGLLGVDETVTIGISYDGANIRFYRNGVQHGSDVAYSTDITLNTNSKFYISDDGATTAFDGGMVKNFKCFNTGLTAQEMLDYHNNSIYNYRNKATVDLPMKAEQHDPTNVKTLDVSGNGYDATFGDGSTPTTYPTKLSKRGYSFDGTNDYMLMNYDMYTAAITSGITIAAVFSSEDVTSGRMIESTLDADNGMVLTVTDPRTGDLRFVCELAGVSKSAPKITWPYPNGKHVVIGTWDGTNNAEVWLDGVLGTGGVHDAGTNSSNPNKTVIGIAADLASNPFNGDLFDIKIFEEVLTPTQIQDLTIEMMKKVNDV